MNSQVNVVVAMAIINDHIMADLEADSEVEKIRFSRKLLDTFDELGREFILAHGNVEFV